MFRCPFSIALKTEHARQLSARYQPLIKMEQGRVMPIWRRDVAIDHPLQVVPRRARPADVEQRGPDETIAGQNHRIVTGARRQRGEFPRGDQGRPVFADDGFHIPLRPNHSQLDLDVIDPFGELARLGDHCPRSPDRPQRQSERHPKGHVQPLFERRAQIEIGPQNVQRLLGALPAFDD